VQAAVWVGTNGRARFAPLYAIGLSLVFPILARQFPPVYCAVAPVFAFLLDWFLARRLLRDVVGLAT
jgi:hypothetical protein